MAASHSPPLIPLSALADDGPALTGIARIAAQAPEVDARNEVAYHDLPCRRLISDCDSPRVPFGWTINPYRGCEMACPYCYARYTHEFMDLNRWEDFERKIFVKRGAAAALVEDLRRKRREGEWIAIGTATDPYQPAERRECVTRSILEVFARYEGLRLSLITKSNLVLRDIDLFQEIARRSELRLSITVTTLRGDLARILEPRAPRPDLRLEAVAGLAAAGLRAHVSLAPVMPRINDALDELEALVAAAAQAGAGALWSQVLFLRRSSSKRFFPFLQEHFPALLPTYQRLYGPNPQPLRNYTAAIQAHLRSLKQRHGLDAGGREEHALPRPLAQPTLFGIEG